MTKKKEKQKENDFLRNCYTKTKSEISSIRFYL